MDGLGASKENATADDGRRKDICLEAGEQVGLDEGPGDRQERGLQGQKIEPLFLPNKAMYLQYQN